MTILSRDDISKGDIVAVEGYGGFAEVLHIEQDGYTPPRPNRPSVPKYRVTIKWGPYNPLAGSSKRNIDTGRNKPRTGTLIEDFALGRLRPPNYVEGDEQVKAIEQQQAEQQEEQIATMDEPALRARLAELNAQLSA